jgi:hypothetical protein
MSVDVVAGARRAGEWIDVGIRCMDAGDFAGAAAAWEDAAALMRAIGAEREGLAGIVASAALARLMAAAKLQALH